MPKPNIRIVLRTNKTKDITHGRIRTNMVEENPVENIFFRFKNSFGSKFLSRNEENMKNKMTTKCQLLNKMLKIGKPKSTRIA